MIIPILLLIAVLGLGLLWLQRRRAAGEGAEGGYDDGDRWPSEATGPARLPHYAESAQDQSPGYDWAAPGGQAKTMPGAEDVFDGDPDSIDTTPPGSRSRAPAGVRRAANRGWEVRAPAGVDVGHRRTRAGDRTGAGTR